MSDTANGRNMKKAIISLIILLIAAGTVFVFGWIQIFVPIGKYGVLASKTSGIDPVPITNGVFRWQWERLIPTNTELYVFSIEPKRFTTVISGELPYASEYNNAFSTNYDFSYNYTVTLSLSVKPDLLPQLVKDYSVKTDENLSELLSQQVQNICGDIVQFMINSGETEDISFQTSLDVAKITDGIDLSGKYPFVLFNSIELKMTKSPDLVLYKSVKNSYSEYRIKSQEQILDTTVKETQVSSEDYFLFERYRNLGKLLTEYPLLIDYIAVQQDDLENAFEKLKTVRTSKTKAE